MAEVHKRFGKLPWPDLFEESAQIAEDGFEIYKYLGDAIEDKENWFQMPEYGWEAYLNDDGTIKKEGDIIKLSFQLELYYIMLVALYVLRNITYFVRNK